MHCTPGPTNLTRAGKLAAPGAKNILKSYLHTGIPGFTLLMWGHIKKHAKQKSLKWRLLSSTKVEENRIEV
mgnify:CR=1 FL=1